MLDIHSHILPSVDDGASNIENSIKLLEMLSEQGVTDVIATPHFYAMNNSIEDFEQDIKNAYFRLSAAVAKKDLPNISVGSEVFYFTGIGRSYGVRALTLCQSNYILLELPNCRMDKDILNDVRDLSDRLGLRVILAHLERYHLESHFKDVLRLVDNDSVFVQINASSFFNPVLKKAAFKLIKGGYVSFLASDTHSPDGRPPMITDALAEIERRFDKDTAQSLIDNSVSLKNEIFKVNIYDK